MKRLFHVLLLTTLVCAHGGALAAGAFNFVVIMADDLGAKELGCYGHPTHQTPRLDRLAKEGTRFLTAYATPLCTTTRVLLMTGQYPQRTGYYGMHGARPKAASPLNDIGAKFTFGDLLKNKGYRTGLAGKWQLSGELPGIIRDCGFDEYRMWAYKHNLPKGVEHTGAWEGPIKPERFWHPSIVENTQYKPTQADDYGPDLFTEFVTDFIRRRRAEPFFVYYPMCLTHGPFYSTPDSTRTAADRRERSRTNFRANVEYMDKLVGRIVDTVDELGLAERTIIIFTGDNGTGGEGKGTVTELGVRVPLIVRGPGVVKAGVRSRALVSLADIFPTLGEFGGAELPKGHHIDGTSFASVLRGETTEHRAWLYSYLNDRKLARDERWLLEGDGRLFDCGDSRDGTGYQIGEGPEADAARRRLSALLGAIPGPESLGDQLTPSPGSGR